MPSMAHIAASTPQAENMSSGLEDRPREWAAYIATRSSPALKNQPKSKGKEVPQSESKGLMLEGQLDCLFAQRCLRHCPGECLFPQRQKEGSPPQGERQVSAHHLPSNLRLFYTVVCPEGN